MISSKNRNASVSPKIKSFQKLPVSNDPIDVPYTATVDEARNENCMICLANFSRFNPPFHVPCDTSCRTRAQYVHGRCIYQWMTLKANLNEVPSCPLCRGPLSPFEPKTFVSLPNAKMLEYDINLRKNFVITPLSKSFGKVHCYIRVRNVSKLPKVKHLLIDLFYQSAPYSDGTYLPKLNYPKRSDSFLLSAESQSSIQSIYKISADLNRKNGESDRVGTLKGDMLGYSYSLNYVDSSCDKELVGISYKKIVDKDNSNGAKIMQLRVCTPKVIQTSSTTTIDRSVANQIESNLNSDLLDIEDDSHLNWEIAEISNKGNKKGLKDAAKAFKKTENSDQIKLDDSQMKYWLNQTPKWNSETNTYTLDFKDRMAIQSKKNFSLLSTNEKTSDPSDPTLQFVKILKGNNVSVYAMDVQWPFSILQAFGICVSRIDPKLC